MSLLDNEETRKPYLILGLSNAATLVTQMIPASSLVRSVIIGIWMLVAAVCTVILVKRSEKKLIPIVFGLLTEVMGVNSLYIVQEMPGGLAF